MFFGNFPRFGESWTREDIPPLTSDQSEKLIVFRKRILSRIHRKGREDRSGDGLVIAVPSNISAQQILIQIQQIRESEILAIKTDVRNISFYIVNIYPARRFNIMLIKSFLESLTDPMFIFGDFNFHHPMWESNHISRYSNDFVEWITDSNWVLNATVPPYRSSAGAASLIDLTVCSSSMPGYCNSYVLDCCFESDHSPIITELSLLNSNKRIFKKADKQL
ncbi:replication-associated protein [Trichonephila clavipes]|nr:replication-associated protein [Trichonephila clavipes]